MRHEGVKNNPYSLLLLKMETTISVILATSVPPFGLVCVRLKEYNGMDG